MLFFLHMSPAEFYFYTVDNELSGVEIWTILRYFSAGGPAANRRGGAPHRGNRGAPRRPAVDARLPEAACRRGAEPLWGVETSALIRAREL